MNFKLWLESSSGASEYDFRGSKGNWVTPDNIWRTRGSETFIYTDDELFLHSNGVGLSPSSTHIEFLQSIPHLKEKVEKKLKKNYVDFMDCRAYRIRSGLNETLFGRFVRMDSFDFMNRFNISDKSGKRLTILDYEGPIMLVTFWNTSMKLYDKYLSDCMIDLKRYPSFNYKEGEKEIPIFLSTPVHKLKYMPDVLGGGRVVGVTLSPEEKERIAMHQRLHLEIGRAHV